MSIDYSKLVKDGDGQFVPYFPPITEELFAGLSWRAGVKNLVIEYAKTRAEICPSFPARTDKDLMYEIGHWVYLFWEGYLIRKDCLVMDEGVPRKDMESTMITRRAHILYLARQVQDDYLRMRVVCSVMNIRENKFRLSPVLRAAIRVMHSHHMSNLYRRNEYPPNQSLYWAEERVREVLDFYPTIQSKIEAGNTPTNATPSSA